MKNPQVFYHLRLPVALHEALKVTAGLEGRSMRDQILLWVENGMPDDLRQKVLSEIPAEPLRIR